MLEERPKKLKFVGLLTNHRTCRNHFVFANELNGANMSLIVAPTQYPGMTIGSRANGPITDASLAAKSMTKVDLKTSLGDLSSNLYRLQANIKNIGSIEIDNPSSGSLTFKAADLIKYKNVIDKISGNRSLAATDVSMAYFDDINRIKNVSAISIKDSTNNIQNNISSLISNNSKITTITRTNPASVLIVDDKNYLSANAIDGVFSKMKTSAGAVDSLTGLVNVTGVAVSDAATRASNTNTKINKISVADSLVNIVANANSLKDNTAKINFVNTKGPVTATLSSSTYTAFKLNHSELIGKIANSQNPNALNKAFIITDATIEDSSTTGILGADSRVRSINVKDTVASGTKLPATNLLSSKINQVDLTFASADPTASVDYQKNLDFMVALGSKLTSVKVNSTQLTLDAGVDRDKSKDRLIFDVLAKTKGSDNAPVGVYVKNAQLSDIAKLMPIKQVNKADIVTNVKDLLDFSSDGFAAIPVANTITITLADNATNINDNAAKLAKAITTYNDKVLKLQVADTAEKLGANIDGLQSVVSALKSANLGNTAITIDQTDNASNVKVSYDQYTSAKDVLAYIKADTGRAKGVEIFAGNNDDGVAKAKSIGAQAIAGTNYADVAKVNISFNAATTAVSDYTAFASLTDKEFDSNKTNIAIGATVYA